MTEATPMQSFWMRMSEAGGVLEQREVPVPTAGPGQLLVRLHAASLNRGSSWRAMALRVRGGRPAGRVLARWLMSEMPLVDFKSAIV